MILDLLGLLVLFIVFHYMVKLLACGARFPYGSSLALATTVSEIAYLLFYSLYNVTKQHFQKWHKF